MWLAPLIPRSLPRMATARSFPAAALSAALLLLASGRRADAGGASMPSCFKDPAMAMCADADKYYTAELQHRDLDMLCNMMPYMSGCAVRKACASATVSSTSGAGGSQGVPGAHGTPCAPWTLLFDLCTPMPGMMGCGHFTALCGNSSTVVEQCTAFKPTPDLVPYAAAAKAVVSMCASMPGMRGCSTCTSDEMPNLKSTCPNPLLSLSRVCMSMAGMPMCDPWTKMCGVSVSSSEVPEASATTTTNNNADALPEFCDDQWTNSTTPGEDACRAAGMQMTFHGGLHDAVLFREWYACTGAQYFFVLLLVFAVSAASSSLRLKRGDIERSVLLMFACHRSAGFGGWGGDDSASLSSEDMDVSLLARENGKEQFVLSMAISGMTCQACVSTVTNALMQISECVSADVNLKRSRAVVVVRAANRAAVAQALKRMTTCVADVGFEASLVMFRYGGHGGQGCCCCFHRDSPYPRSLVLALFTAIQMTVDYALMLAAMTFNTGVFFGVVVGYSFPTIFLAHRQDRVDGENRAAQVGPACCEDPF